MSAEFIARTFENTDYRSPSRFIWSHIRRHRLYAVMMVFGAFSNAALASVAPILIGIAVDSIIDGKDASIAAWMGLGVVVSQLVRGVVQFARNFASEIFAQRIERDVRDELY